MKILRLDLLFLLLAVVLIIFVLWPIRQAGVDFPFELENALLIMTAILLFRHVFLLKYSYVERFLYIKIALIPLSIAFFFILIRQISSFTTYIDEQPLADLMPHLSYDRQRMLTNFIHTEYLVFAIMALVATALLPVRLLISIWKQVNK